MICRDCDGRIDRNGRCTRCGKPIGSLEGGIGFWDLVSKPTVGAPRLANISVNTEEVERLIYEGTERLDKGLGHIYRRQMQTSKPVTVLLTVIAVLLVVGLLLDAWLLWTVHDIRNAISETTVEETTQSTLAMLPTETFAQIETATPTEMAEPTEVPVTEVEYRNIIIRDLPSDVLLSGRKTDRQALFSITAVGNDLSFQWVKKGNNGKWNLVDNNFLEVENVFDEGVGTSVLYQRTFHESLYGTYKCIIKDSITGYTEESEEVEVLLK